ncbi:hypothetical protein MUK42_35343 [Musa troglodytarum]|uniref:Uncharacterized protein n=1 Tax=Musa troglodytarum TaxID=320322 RepID=A0A9E7JCG3_9LILI|nr:hypothetical protein MUK42_35343 [Musa troglodytarum]
MMALGRVGRTLFRTDTSVSTDSPSNLTSTLGASTPSLKSPCNILQVDCSSVMGTFDMAEDDGFDLHLQVCMYLNLQAYMRRIKPCLTCGPLEGLLLVITTSLHEKSGSGHTHSHVRNWVEAARSTSAQKSMQHLFLLSLAARAHLTPKTFSH